MKFQPGDVVMVICDKSCCARNYGRIGVVIKRCDCLLSQMSDAMRGAPFYRVTGLDGNCFREDTLKKIGGECEPVRVDKDEPVAA